MGKKNKTDLSITASSACGTISSNCCATGASINYLGVATAADGTSTNVLSTCTGITAQEAYNTLECTTLDANTVITTDSNALGMYYYPYQPSTNELTITTTPNIWECANTIWGGNGYSISVDLANIDWFVLKSNRKRITLKFTL